MHPNKTPCVLSRKREHVRLYVSWYLLGNTVHKPGFSVRSRLHSTHDECSDGVYHDDAILGLV